MNQDKYRIDGHKLMLHPERVAHWLRGEVIAPLYIEFSPSGTCNHRCTFCAMDFRGYNVRYLPTEVFCSRLPEWGKVGVKACSFAGEGEPFMHKDMPLIAQKTKEAGIDIAFTTNGVLLNPDKAKAVLPVTTWIKVSCAAATPETYAKVHRTSGDDLSIVFTNLEAAANFRSKQNLSCTLGLQMLLLPENRKEAVILAQKAREIGLDYFVIKPYFAHEFIQNRKYHDIAYSNLEELEAELNSINTENFSVIFRAEAIHRRSIKKESYHRCLATPFWSFVDSLGDMYACCVNVGQKAFYYGNILEQSAEEILYGEQHKRVTEFVENHYSISKCAYLCRMDLVNRYLWELRNPGPHVNFI